MSCSSTQCNDPGQDLNLDCSIQSPACEQLGSPACPSCSVEANNSYSYHFFLGVYIPRLTFHHPYVYTWTVLNSVSVETSALNHVSTTLSLSTFIT